MFDGKDRPPLSHNVLDTEMLLEAIDDYANHLVDNIPR